MAASKEDTIKKVYYEHFGSIKRTLKEAREIDPTIKEKDIKAWKDRGGGGQRKINLAGNNSFVASEPQEEYQMDLFLMPVTKTMDMRKMTKDREEQATTQARRRRKGEGMALTEEGAQRSSRPEMATGRFDRGQKRVDVARGLVPKMKKNEVTGKYEYQKGLYRYGLLLVDIFTKVVQVEPIKDAKGPTLKTALKKLFPLMGGDPQTLYSDGEGGLETGEMTGWFSRRDIRLLQTRTHAHFAERHIRTVKDMIFKRMDHKKVHPDNWQTLLPEILTEYNTKMEHSATGLTPEEASKPRNLALVKGRLQVKALKSRKYPDIVVGDEVKYFQKKDKLDKERVSTWSTKTSVVTDITESHGQKYYVLDPRPLQWKGDLQRSEILKVT